ncbi:M1 family aminopeptidase [Flavobacterium sp. H122]|uniref:M1 family aminopeptidase n=1 Tax=Flavobacterium sp. H122 TaxID=2529860 RepID=UPI0020BEE0F1|nr:M1 family aminopeptidase [Flavobacterium sp. H122]
MINYGRELLSHELAHQWFGDKVTCGTWKDIWLNEGITEYMSGCVIENFDVPTNPSAFTNWKKNKIANVNLQPASDSNLYLTDAQLSDVNRIFSGRITYDKGALVAHMLRYIMGDDNFFHGLRNYLSNTSYAYKYATTEQFKAEMENLNGIGTLNEFFNDWVYGKGLPVYSISVSNLPESQLRIVVNQTQTDPSVSFFEMPLEFKITLSDNSVIYRKVNNTSNDQIFVLDLPEGLQATKVEFNTNSDLIVSGSSAVTLSNNYIILNDEVVIYPNPVNEIISIDIPSNLKLNKIIIYDLLGKKIIESVSNKINVSKIGVGIYNLIVETDKGRASKKIIKN